MAAIDDVDSGSAIDYLGRSQPLGRKSLSLTSSGGGGQVTAPLTPSLGERVSGATQLAQQVGRSGQDLGGLNELGLSRAGLQFAQEALRTFGPGAAPPSNTAPESSAHAAPDIPLAEGQPTMFPTGAGETAAAIDTGAIVPE